MKGGDAPMVEFTPTWGSFFADRAKSQLSGQALDVMMRYILERFVMQRPAIPELEKQMFALVAPRAAT